MRRGSTLENSPAIEWPAWPGWVEAPLLVALETLPATSPGTAGTPLERRIEPTDHSDGTRQADRRGLKPKGEMRSGVQTSDGVPGIGARQRPISFGTGGWRGILGEEITFPRIRATLAAIAHWTLRQRRGRRVVVAYDTRFMGDRMVATAVAMLRERGLEPLVSQAPVPTPVMAHAIRARDAAAGVMFTASHNPSDYHGIKVFGHWGGSVSGEDVSAIEDAAQRELALAPVCELASDFERCDFIDGYSNDLLDTIDRSALRKSPLRVRYDALHGTGAGVLDAVLRRAGVEVSTRRGELDPLFGGTAPDPIPANLGELSLELRSQDGLSIGLATDGDADRVGAVDGDGRILSETEVLALLVDHLARTGRALRGVAISLATGSLVERVARFHGLSVSRHPSGFKHLSKALRSGSDDVAGDESGGFAFAGLGCDKDGILAGCFLAEICAVTGKSLSERLRELEARHGRWVAGRLALPTGAHHLQRLAKLLAMPPEWVDGSAVRSVAVVDGLHIRLDDGFLILRASGTEPVIRVFAEARDPHTLQRRLATGRQLLDRR